MNVFKATSVEIMSVPPLIVWFLSTVEHELVLLGEGFSLYLVKSDISQKCIWRTDFTVISEFIGRYW